MIAPSCDLSREQKLLRQRQHLLKRQKECVAGSFGVTARDDGPSVPKKGNNWAQFLVEVPERPNSRTDRAPSAGSYVKVVVGRPGSRESEAEAFPPPAQGSKLTPPASAEPLLEQSFGSTMNLDSVLLEHASELRGLSKPERSGEAHGWDLQVLDDSREPSKEKPQGRRPFFGLWGGGRNAHFELEQEVPTGISAFDADAECHEAEDDSFGPTAAPSRSRAQTPWPADLAIGGPLGATSEPALPGVLESPDGASMRRHAQEDPFDLTCASLDLTEN